MTEEHDRALKAALMGPVDEAALDAQAARELPRAPAFTMPTRGEDLPAVPPKLETPEDHQAFARAWRVLAAAQAGGHHPTAFVLNPDLFPGATALCGLPVRRSEDLPGDAIEVE